jgi:hypothetical protein
VLRKKADQACLLTARWGSFFAHKKARRSAWLFCASQESRSGLPLDRTLGQLFCPQKSQALGLALLCFARKPIRLRS